METNQHNQHSKPRETFTHRFPANWRTEEETLNRLTHGIAIVTNRTPDELDIGMHRIVDSDALDRLFAPEANAEDAQVTLMVSDFEIRLRADGSFLVVE